MSPPPSHYPPLYALEIAPPYSEPKDTYIYGYKLFANYDANNQEHNARLAKIYFTVARLGLYGRLLTSPTVLVFFTIYDPKVNVVTPRAGNTRIPGQRLLEALQEQMGIYLALLGMQKTALFRNGYTAERELITKGELIKMHKWASKASSGSPLLVIELASMAVPSPLLRPWTNSWFFCNLVTKSFLSDDYLLDVMRPGLNGAFGSRKRVFVERALTADANGDNRFEFLREYAVDVVPQASQNFWRQSVPHEMKRWILSQYTAAHLTSRKASGGGTETEQYAGSIVRKYYDFCDYIPMFSFKSFYQAECYFIAMPRSAV
ncbi:hypothetical protein B0H17DRAFT_1205610 [Mycena rosella]|uniref:Uncharacterized protein n=1 Tax=Mycena rosella TaxID=1033263 RepID=A0AAD7GEP0_MYCRO|nr:hypothetical protein B0H17DRAFT_1205610 [Mycena rosella]